MAALLPQPTQAQNDGIEFTLTDALDLHRTLAQSFIADCSERPVRPYTSPEGVDELLAVAPTKEGLAGAELGEKLKTLLSLTPATGTKRFFNQLFGGNDPAALLGDMLAPLLNTSMYTWKVAGPHVLIENAIVAHMAEFAGMSGGEGVFTPGGSLSNMTAMLIARNEAIPGYREEGSNGARGRVYSSADAHYSIRKSAGMVGIGRDNVVSIETDENGCMSADALDAAIQRDKLAGYVPMMINTTAGTTVQGAFDPIDEIATVAEKHGVWQHVDGAFGGSLLLSDTHRHKLAGLSRADSLTWDAHKLMGVPLTCSVLLTRQPGILTKHLSESASYLFQGDSDQFNPGTRSIQCGRRNDLLKLWTAWQRHGDDGYRARIDYVMTLAAYAVKTVEDDSRMHMSHRPQSVNVCFEVDGKPSAEICKELQAKGLAMVGTGDVRGRTTVRLVCVDPSMTTTDIDVFFHAVRAVCGY
jgi:glutamate/tyrosine decarboxylase-like PLP-dependent enzyme